jgi:hypothetical protein
LDGGGGGGGNSSSSILIKVLSRHLLGAPDGNHEE